MNEIEIKLTKDEVLQLKRGEPIIWISYEKQIKVKIKKE
tara:strand:+ start:306 stop:422 length:117 start_codon:yes stop_codon:yes gene_type:complete